MRENVHHKQRTDKSQVWNFPQLWDPLNFNSFLTFGRAGVLWHPEVTGVRLVEMEDTQPFVLLIHKVSLAQLSSAGGGGTSWAAPLQQCQAAEREFPVLKCPNFHRKWLKFLQDLDSPSHACAPPWEPSEGVHTVLLRLVPSREIPGSRMKTALIPKNTPLAFLL